MKQTHECWICAHSCSCARVRAPSSHAPWFNARVTFTIRANSPDQAFAWLARAACGAYAQALVSIEHAASDMAGRLAHQRTQNAAKNSVEAASAAHIDRRGAERPCALPAVRVVVVVVRAR